MTRDEFEQLVRNTLMHREARPQLQEHQVPVSIFSSTKAKGFSGT